MTLYTYIRSIIDRSSFKSETIYEYSYINDMPFEDFTFKCTDGDVKAHRCILWTRCLYFKTTVWEINECEVKVDCTVKTMTEVINFFYGREHAIDVDGLRIINMLNPSPENLTLIIPQDTSKWNELLDNEEITRIGFTRDQIVNEMAEYAIEEWHVCGEDSMILNTEIVKKMISNSVIDNENIVVLISSQRNNDIITDNDVRELCKLVNWMYIRCKFGIILDQSVIECMPVVTPEKIRQAYLNPKYTKHFKGIKACLKFGTLGAMGDAIRSAMRNRKYEYDKDCIVVLGREYPLHEVFKDADEFNTILERDKSFPIHA